MEDVREYRRIEDEKPQRREEEERRIEYEAAPDDEVPFYIPRD